MRSRSTSFSFAVTMRRITNSSSMMMRPRAKSQIAQRMPVKSGLQPGSTQRYVSKPSGRYERSKSLVSCSVCAASCSRVASGTTADSSSVTCIARYSRFHVVLSGPPAARQSSAFSSSEMRGLSWIVRSSSVPFISARSQKVLNGWPGRFAGEEMIRMRPRVFSVWGIRMSLTTYSRSAIAPPSSTMARCACWPRSVSAFSRSQPAMVMVLPLGKRYSPSCEWKRGRCSSGQVLKIARR